MNAMPETIPEEIAGENRGVEPVRLYKVIFLNDDRTTFEFVVWALISIFKKDPQTASRLTMEVHHQGSAHVDTLPREQAELRREQVHQAAGRDGFPFRCLIEPL